MNESALLDHSLQYEQTIRSRLKHPRPEPSTEHRKPTTIWIRLAHALQAVARMLEPERSDGGRLDGKTTEVKNDSLAG